MKAYLIAKRRLQTDSSCIANRLKNVLSSLINEDQTGVMTNRYMGDHIRLMYDIIHYLNYKNVPDLPLFIDFEKAFDSVDWNFMMNVLKAFGFGPSICQYLLYENEIMCDCKLACYTVVFD